MDVQCERCKTEYEFDDALVSGRGTTVRCSDCGHEFKVRRPGSESFAGELRLDAEPPDKWIVQTGSGQQLTFLTLRELQRAILAKRVTRLDVLVPVGSPPRALGSIAELESFFAGRVSSQSHPAAPPRTESVITAPIVLAGTEEPPESLKRTVPWGRQMGSAPPPAVAFRRNTDTLRPLPSAGAAPPPATEPPPPWTEVASRAPAPAAVPASASAVGLEPTVLPPATSPIRRPMPSTDDEAQEIRARFDSSSDEAFGIPARRRVGGWVVAVALLLAVAVAGWVVAKPYLAARSGGAASQLDGRAEAFLAKGEQALTDGDLDGAQEQFDKASALAERDPRVLRDEARVAVAKADIPWLKLRLLPADASEESRTTKAQLDVLASRARAAADAAVAATPEDPAALRSKIDAMRMLGERGDARSYVTRVLAHISQPETAYVLAALDLAEASPLWTTVLDRLRLAAGAEGTAGRARAALVYALAKSGNPGEAKSELAKLDALTRPYALSPNLHAFVDRATSTSPSAQQVKSLPSAALVASAARPEATARTPHPVGPSGMGAGPTAGGWTGGSAGGVPPDAPSAMQAAARAIHRGDWARARQIYEAIVARNPNDSEALAGIGDVARAQGDLSGAIAAYKRTLAVNPSYLPALLGLADTEWAIGDRAGAQRTYKNLVDHFPDGTYPSYVKGRAESAPPSAPSATTTAEPPASESSSGAATGAKPLGEGQGL